MNNNTSSDGDVSNPLPVAGNVFGIDATDFRFSFRQTVGKNCPPLLRNDVDGVMRRSLGPTVCKQASLRINIHNCERWSSKVHSEAPLIFILFFSEGMTTVGFHAAEQPFNTGRLKSLFTLFFCRFYLTWSATTCSQVNVTFWPFLAYVKNASSEK